MIKNALKNFFKNIIYVFIPMGIVYLVFLIAFFALVAGVIQFAGTMLHDVMALVQTSSEQSSASVTEFFAYSAEQLKWNGNIWDLFRTIFETNWIQNTVVGFFRTLNESTEGFGEQISEIVGTFRTQTVALVSGVAVLCVLGVIFANFITRVAIRRRTAKRGLKKFILAHTVVPLVQALLLIASAVLFSYIKYYSILAVVLFLLIAIVISLVSSWIVHRDGSVKLKDVITLKNILLHLASVGIILLINVVLAVALFLIDPFFAILILIPFVLYSLNVADVNTDSIVCTLIERKKGEKLQGASGVAEAS